MKRKTPCNPLIFLSACNALIFCIICSQAKGQENDNRSQRYALMDAEKSLLAQQDDVSRQIAQLNFDINEKQKSLTSAHQRLESIRHQLISIQMKLLP